MGLHHSQSLTPPQPDAGFSPNDLFVPGVIARAQFESVRVMQLGAERALHSAVQPMIAEINELVRESGLVTLHVVIGHEEFKIPRGPKRKYMQ